MLKTALLVGLFVGTFVMAQAPDIAGKWEGALEAGGAKLRLQVDLSRSSDGLYLGSLTSIDQGGVKIPIDRITATGSAVHFELKMVNGVYDGSLDAGGNKMTGTWTQGGPNLPLEFTRTGEAPAAPAPAPADFAAPSPFGLPFDLEIPTPPVPFTAGGKTHLVYELHITYFQPVGRDLLIRKIDVLDGPTAIASIEGGELNSALMRIGAAGDDKRVLDAGRRAVVWLWITLDSGQRVPASLRHRVMVGDETVEGGLTTVSRVKPPTLGPPLRGSDWMALNGPGNASIHRRALLPAGGKAHVAQRFAIDWVQIGADGSSFTGDAKDNKNYHAYGKEVLAVADAVVSEVKDGIPQNVPGINSRAVPINLETVGGNHIVLDLGGGRFAFYAHLQPGSLRVKTGDHVRRGQTLALLGNSGNSTEPHLHFHVSDGASPLGSEGVPYVLESFDLLGAAPEARHNEIPLQNMRVRFPDTLVVK